MGSYYKKLLKVHCRIGSLENVGAELFVPPLVHCRIGSLEIHAVL